MKEAIFRMFRGYSSFNFITPYGSFSLPLHEKYTAHIFSYTGPFGIIGFWQKEEDRLIMFLKGYPLEKKNTPKT